MWSSCLRKENIGINREALKLYGYRNSGFNEAEKKQASEVYTLSNAGLKEVFCLLYLNIEH